MDDDMLAALEGVPAGAVLVVCFARPIGDGASCVFYLFINNSLLVLRLF